MKKFAIVTLPLLLAACVSDDYVTNVTSDSYQEEYKRPKLKLQLYLNLSKQALLKKMLLTLLRQSLLNKK